MTRITAICIGTELLRGEVLNTNLAFLGRQIQQAGFLLISEHCVPDQPTLIRLALEKALAESDLVVTIGGLGPTSDDLTRQVAADILGVALQVHPEVEKAIEAYFSKRNIKIPCAAIERQALVPEGVEIVNNMNGTAPGLICNSSGKYLVLLPGPPREFNPMVQNSIIPWLKSHFEPDFFAGQFRICGLAESIVAERVEALLGSHTDLQIGYCATPAGVDVHLRLGRNTSAEKILNKYEQQLRSAFADAMLTKCSGNLAEAVGNLLKQKKWSVATAESCTGGGIAEAITDIAGASEYFAGAVITYANSWKQQYLKVPEQTLAEFGAVSAETAREMVSGLLKHYHSDTGIAVTGIAGPGGGTEEKPVGLVFIATAIPGKIEINRYVFSGDRASVRQRTVATALNQLRLNLLTGMRFE